MLALLWFYYCVPRRFRFILRWLAMCLFMLVVAGVLVLFSRVFLAVSRNHGHWLLHPRSHQPLSPDFIVSKRRHPNSQEMYQ
jgi:hypothetical protein